MGTPLDELLVGLGFEYDPSDLADFEKDLAKTKEHIKSIVKYASAAAAAITAMVVSSTRASDEQGRLSKEIGENVENIDALSYAARKAGDSSDSMVSSLRNLSLRAGEAFRGVGSGVEVFGLLGVSVTDAEGKIKPVSNLILEISDRFKGLDKAKQIELADKLGIRDSIRLLQEGPESIRKLIEEAKILGVTTNEDAAISKEFSNSLTDLWQIIKQVTRTITRQLAPIMADINKRFIEWWKTNRQLIESKIPKWIDDVSKAIKILTIVISAFMAVQLVSHIITLIKLFKGLSFAALAANAAVFLIPATIATAIAAFALLIEDAKTFFEGGKSFIGDMIEKFPKWGNQIRAIASIFKYIYDTITRIMNSFKSDNLFSLGFTGKTRKLLENLGVPLTQDPNNPEVGQLFKITTSDAKRGINQIIDKVEILVQGGVDSAEKIAEKVQDIFKQTTHDLSSAVDR